MRAATRPAVLAAALLGEQRGEGDGAEAVGAVREHVAAGERGGEKRRQWCMGSGLSLEEAADRDVEAREDNTDCGATAMSIRWSRPASPLVRRNCGHWNSASGPGHRRSRV